MSDYLKEIQKDVDDMNKSLDSGIVKAPSTDPPAPPNTEEPIIDLEDEVKTDPPSTDPPEEIKTDPPKTEPPSTDAPDDRDQIIEDLRKKLEEKETPKTTPPKTEPPATEHPLEEQDFVGDLELEDLDKDGLNKILNEVFRKGATQGQGKSEFVENLPQIMSTIVTLQEASKKFYEEHEDLVPYKKTVADTFGAVVKENPNRTFSEIFEDVATKSREKLSLKAPSKKTVDKKVPPTLPKKKTKPGKPTEKPKLTETQSQIDEMNKTLLGR